MKSPSFWPVLLLASSLSWLPATAAPVPGNDNVFELSSFGSIATAAQADATLKKAAEAVLAAGGGVILIPANAPKDWKPSSPPQNMSRKPEPPAPAKGWSVGPGVTLIDARQSKVEVPQVTGLEFNRTFNLAPGQSSPHWQYHPMLRLHTNQVAGTSNFSGVLAAPVTAGKAQRFYLESIRSIFPGQMLAVDGSPAEIAVLSLGYDAAKKQPFFVGDAPAAIPAGTRLSALTQSSVIRAETQAHNETQTFDVYSQRSHYSQGDTYMFDGYVHYMGDEYGIPEEGGTEPGAGYGSVLLHARTQTLVNIFRGQVDSFDAKSGALRYTAAINAHTLATGRPLINLNSKKWITEGHAHINVPGGALLNWGGSLWSSDAPWTQDVVGRFFAIDEDSEKVAGNKDVRLWFQITALSVDPDGKKRLTVRRHWWGAKNLGVGISTLFNYKDYTQSEKTPVPLKYIIAPGTYVDDVSDGVGSSPAESAGARQQTIKLVPYEASGTNLDFATGDPIEQAIGPEPFHPIPFRAWFFDSVPGVFPAPVLDVANNGVSPRSAALSVAGNGGLGNVISVNGDVKDGIQVAGEVDGPFIETRVKRNQTEFISWTRGAKPKTLSFIEDRSMLAFNGPWSLNGRGAVGLKGVGRPGPGAPVNLRGLDIAIPTGAKEADISFPNPEPDNKYALTIAPNWMTERAVSKRTTTSFHLIFSTPAPAGANVQWLLVR